MFQCLNLFERDGRVRKGSPLSLRFGQTAENIQLRVDDHQKSRSIDINGNSQPRLLSGAASPPIPSTSAHSSNSPPLSQPTQSLTMPVQDRTNEFRACVESIRNRSTIPSRNAEQKQRLLHAQTKDSPKSEFTRLASGIAKDINTTTIRLGKLAQRERCPPLLFLPC